VGGRVVTVLLALVASVVFGCADFVGGAVSRRASPLRVAAMGQLVALSFAVPAALLVSYQRLTFADAGWSLATGVAAACGLGFFYSAMARGLISLVVPLTAVISATLPVAYGLARGERPGTTALVGIVLALVAVAIVSATPGASQSLSAAPIVFSLAAGTLFGLFIILLSQVSDQAGMWPIALSRSSSSLVLAGLAVAVTGGRANGIRQLLPAGVAIGTLEAGGIVGLFLALQRGPISIASVLLSLYPVTTVLLATIVLGERMSRAQLAGVALALSSVILISAQ
jgi:drug/metabolite transporter (DMT)-like permease